MRAGRKLSGVLFALALVLALLAGLLSFLAAGSRPILLGRPEQAEAAARQLLDAVGKGDFAAVSSCLAGTPSLGDRQQPEDPAAQLLWQEFLNSFTYELRGGCYGSNQGLALDAEVSYLDFESVMEPLGQRTRRLLNRRVSQAGDLSEVYDRNHNYREDLVREVLREALEQTMKTEGKRITRQVTLYLVQEYGQWRVMPKPEVISMISGGTAG